MGSALISGMALFNSVHPIEQYRAGHAAADDDVLSGFCIH